MNGNPPPKKSHNDDGLTEDEIAAVRQIILDNERSTWALKQIKIIVPVLATIVIGLWQIGSWIFEHVSFHK